MKKIITLLLIFCMLLGFTGCTTTETEFLNLIYGKTYKSYSSTGTMEIKLTSKVPDEIKEEMKPLNLQSVLNALSDLKLAWGETAFLGEEDINSKVTLGVSTPSASFVTNAYAYTENNNLITVFDLPSIAKAFLPEGYENADKVYVNYSELNELNTELINMNYADIFKMSQTLNKDMQQFILDYSQYVPEIKGIISKNGTTYMLKISDEQLKSLIENIVSAYLTNENARKTANEFIIKFCEIYKSIYTEEMYNETFGMLAEQLDSMSEEDLRFTYEGFSEIMKTLKTIRLLGENGIKITYKFQGGYIQNLSGIVDFIMDISNISREINGEEFSDDFYIEGIIKYNQSITDVNKLKKTDVIDFNLDNAISAFDWVEAYTNEENYTSDYDYYSDMPDNHLYNTALPSEDGSITVMNYDSKIDMKGMNAKNIGGTLYVPLEPLLDSEYCDYYWDNETKEMVMTIYGDIYYHIKPDTNIIYTDNYQLMLNNNVLVFDGYLYVPLRSFVNAVLGYDIYWSSELNTAFIGGDYYYNWYMGEKG